jgi:O-acetyl-ADP-ribose deacetylase (regulator of RNase III)
VNASNNELWFGGGVAGAIYKAGGHRLDDYCKKWLRDQKVDKL